MDILKPTWSCTQCSETHSLKTIIELTSKLPKKNSYFLVRHGTALHNELGIVNGLISNSFKYPLTVIGVEEIRRVAESLKDKKLTHIFASPFTRTEQTARIIAETVGCEVITDPRLSESNFGDFEEKNENDVVAFAPSFAERFAKNKPNGENLQNVARRMLSFMNEIDAAHEQARICIVSHEDPLRALQWIAVCGIQTCMGGIPPFLRGTMLELDFRALPVTQDGDIDCSRLFELSEALQCTKKN